MQERIRGDQRDNLFYVNVLRKGNLKILLNEKTGDNTVLDTNCPWSSRKSYPRTKYNLGASKTKVKKKGNKKCPSDPPGNMEGLETNSSLQGNPLQNPVAGFTKTPCWTEELVMAKDGREKGEKGALRPASEGEH